MDNYSVLHCHTETSLLDSCSKYYEYADKAAELGQKALAITEHGNIYNWIEKKMYINSKGLKYIHGVECYLTASLKEKVRDNYHTILLAKNYKGFQEINLLIDKSTQEDHFYYKPRITFDEFLNISDNVIKISACLASPLHRYPNDVKAYVQERKTSLYNDIEFYNDYYEEDVCTDFEIKKHELEYLEKFGAKNIFYKLLNKYDYYEIQPHNFKEQKEYNEFLYMASLQMGKPLIVGTDTHSVNYYKAECRSILQKAKKILYSDEDSFDLTYKSYDELVNMFKKQNSNIPFDVILDAINNTNVVADMVEDFELDTSVKYPVLYDNEEHVLKNRIMTKLKYKLDNGIIKKENLHKYKEKITEEMRVFKKINMVGFMLFMSELVCWCWENGIPIGPCRGSVGGSTIAYITDIIDVDPVIWNTIFSRFANEDREEVGDIDLDISPDQRDLVYEHIIETFTYEKTAYILAIGTVSDKGTIDEIGRALDIPLDVVTCIKEQYTSYKNEIDGALEKIKEYQSMSNFCDILKADENSELYSVRKDYERLLKQYDNANSSMNDLKENKYRQLFYYFDGINGTAVSQSIHPAGIVVSPISLPDNYGTFWSKGKRILCINMEEIHDGAGLVKYDLLALKSLQVMRMACEYANIPYPKSHEINWVDKKVWKDIICSPAGVFQFESDQAFRMLKDYKPVCVNDLSMINAALRPSGASYRDRLLAGETNKNPSKLIDDLLADNHGFLIFQEDTIKFLQNICGLSGSQADNVRRAIGRKQIDRLQKALPSILEGYCKMSPQPRNVAEKEVKVFLKIIEDSARYQFGFNHSTGYSMIGYMCAFLRYYYPEEFIAAYLNCASNSDDIVMGTELAKIKHISINNIKFGKSGAIYLVDKKNHAIYKGISSIKFCNEQIADELLELSHNKYKCFSELLYDINNKTSVNSRQLNILIGLDFFSNFGKNKYLMDIVDLYDKFGSCKQINKNKMESLGITDYLMKKYAGKETAKMYKDIDNAGLISEMSKRLENKSMNVVEQIKFEMEYLNYIVYINPRVNESYYCVIEYKTYKEKRKPYITLYNIKTGNQIKTKITSVKLYENDPFGLYSILRVDEFTPKIKKRNINGVWTETDEFEDVLTKYEVIKKE